MPKLIIIGASAMGRETYVYAKDCGMEVKGFLDSRKEILNEYANYPPILGTPEEYIPTTEDVFVCALGEPEQKRKFVEMILGKRGRFISVIHPHSYVGQGVKIGLGSIISPNVTITNDVIIENHVIININSSISHDCKIGNYVTISPGCHIAGWCKIESEVFMGIHSACLPHVRLGLSVFVAAGAVVIKSVGSGCVMGVPARIKMNDI